MSKARKAAAAAAERVRERVGSATGVLLALELLVPLLLELMGRCRKEREREPADAALAVPASVARMPAAKQRRFFERVNARRRQWRANWAAHVRTRAQQALERRGERGLSDRAELEQFVSAYLRGADPGVEARSIQPALADAILTDAAYAPDTEDWLFEEVPGE